MRIPRITTCSVWYQLRGGILPHLTETNNVVQLIVHLQLLGQIVQLIYNALFAHFIYNALFAHFAHFMHLIIFVQFMQLVQNKLYYFR